METTTLNTVAPVSAAWVAVAVDGSVNTAPANSAPVVSPEIVVSIGDCDARHAVIEARLSASGKRVAHKYRAGTTTSMYHWTEWEKYSRKSYPRDRNGVQIRSVGRIESAGDILVYQFAALPTETYHAPRGYQWVADGYGIALCRTSTGDKYHPTAAELIDVDNRRQAVRGIVLRLRENAKTRRAQDKEQAKTARINARVSARLAAENARALATRQREEDRRIKTAIKTGCVVTLADSMRAGNCQAGTLQFAESKRFDGRGVALEKLLKYRKNAKVWRTIVVAIARHELEQSAAQVAELHTRY